jgi:hypothetical protein
MLSNKATLLVMILKRKVSLGAKQCNAKILFTVIASEAWQSQTPVIASEAWQSQTPVIASEAWQSLRGKYISFDEIASLCLQ